MNEYEKIKCEATNPLVYHSVQWIAGKNSCADCGIELIGDRKTAKYSWVGELV